MELIMNILLDQICILEQINWVCLKRIN
jgi:hypothetical protein